MKSKAFTIGRSAENDIVLNDYSVSRKHLEVIIDEQGNVVIGDLQSMNGTYINGNRLVGYEMLQKGDILILGTCDPIRWSEWLSEDFLATNKKVEENVLKPIDDNSLTIAPPRKNKVGLVVIGLLLIIVVVAFIYESQNRSVIGSSHFNKVYTLKELQSNSFNEIEILAGDKVNVNFDDLQLKTSDGLDVRLYVENGRLIKVENFE